MTSTAITLDYLIPGTSESVAAWYRNLPIRAQEDFELFEDEYVIMDTETTGLDPAHDQLIEIAACVLRGAEVIDRFQTFVDPGRLIPEEISQLTGITQEDVAGAPDPSLAVEMFADFADGRDIVAHNAEFDKSFVMRQAVPGAIEGTWLDSLPLSRIVLPRLRSHRLIDLVSAFGLYRSTHRACDDVEALAQLWRILQAAAHSLAPGLAAAIASMSAATDWPLRQVFSRAALAAPSADFSLRRCRSEQITASARPAKGDAADGLIIVPSDEEVEQAFSAEGAAGRMYEGYEQRNEQLQMALEVTDALRQNSYRALEAGTGVGKSMAYLLPCALTAKTSNITVGVATKTNALMDQLVYNELPRLAKALGGLNYVALKGYEHYPCLRKLETLGRDEQDAKPEVIEMAAMLYVYTSQTAWGDLDSINQPWFGVPRYAVEANANDCLKRKCPFFPNRCFLHGARKAANSADVVVTNHALLFRDVQADNGILPPIRHWVVDEAHAVEAEARRQLSHTVSARDLDVLFHRLNSSRNGTISQIRRKAPELEGGTLLLGVTADCSERIYRLTAISTSFFSFVKDLANESRDRSTYDYMTLWIGPQLRETGSWQTLLNPGRSLSSKLNELVKRLRDLVTSVEEFEELNATASDLANSICTLQEASESLDLILDGSNDNYVYSAELNRATDRPAESLSAFRLDIGSALALDFYPNVSSVIYTSATLATGSDSPFAYFNHSSGLDLMPEARLGCRQLESSYDFDGQMQVLLPKGMPEPNSSRYKGALAQLLMDVHTAMGGSVLTLFTNRREMEELYRQLKPQLHTQGIELIAQTKGTSTKSLRDRFIADESLCLFALKSFWEGFDAPGDTLRCVVIPKLPFGRPNDPINCERNLREGRDAWSRYSLPEAVMDLKQAAGRLIRKSTDSGFLVLADGRLQTKGYGRQFLNALPTTNIRVVDPQELTEIMRRGL